MSITTLDEMYNETAMYVDESIGISPYTTATATLAKFRSALNYAYKKIARERWKPSYKENITLGATKKIDTSTLNYSYNGIRYIRNDAGFDVYYKASDDNLIECSNNQSGDVLTISYYYIPSDLVLLTDTMVFPEDVVDAKILCFYAAYMYLLIDDEDTANYWLTLFNNGVDSIAQNSIDISRVKNRMWS